MLFHEGFLFQFPMPHLPFYMFVVISHDGHVLFMLWTYLSPLCTCNTTWNLKTPYHVSVVATDESRLYWSKCWHKHLETLWAKSSRIKSYSSRKQLCNVQRRILVSKTFFGIPSTLNNVEISELDFVPKPHENAYRILQHKPTTELSQRSVLPKSMSGRL